MTDQLNNDLNSLMGKLINVKDIRIKLEEAISYWKLLAESTEIDNLKRLLVISKLTIVQEMATVKDNVKFIMFLLK